MHQRILFVVGLFLLVCIPLACGGGGGGPGVVGAAPQADYGDAPDGGPTGYPAPFAAVGNFPTLFASNGARSLDWTQAFLGTSASGEVDATDPADPDGVPNLTNSDRDDGITDLVILLTAIPPPTTLTVEVAALSSTASQRYYLNVLIDLTMNGSWGDTGAGGESEWVVRNLGVTTVPGSAIPVDDAAVRLQQWKPAPRRSLDAHGPHPRTDHGGELGRDGLVRFGRDRGPPDPDAVVQRQVLLPPGGLQRALPGRERRHGSLPRDEPGPGRL